MKMHGFSIDYLTGNTTVPTAYTSHEFEPNTKQDHVQPVAMPTYYPPVHLDDVYSVISNDVNITGSSGLALPLDLPTASASCLDDAERGTPSPNRDSGIESDHSPAHSSTSSTASADSTEKTMTKLEHTANNVDAKPPASSTDKPGTSYLALIAKAIISSPQRKLTLGDIYRHIMANNPFYDNSEKAWRGSIRYTLSINECFIKDGKDESGKGNFWAIHPACLDDFEKGDYRRRQARRRAKRNVKSVSTFVNTPAITSHQNSYQPMTSAYVSNPYGNEQPTYAYTPQGYGYAYVKPEVEAVRTQHPGASAVPAPAQIHPAFGYPVYAAPYGYMYQDYSASESAYRRELEKLQQQYESTDSKKWCFTTDQSEASVQSRDHSPSGAAPSSNEIHIL